MSTLVILILAAGALGGLGNVLMSVSFDTQDTAPRDFRRLRFEGVIAVVLGIIAAALMPLFLSMASSKLVATVIEAPQLGADGVVFFGFCLVAALFSRRFIDSVAERALKLAKDAKQKAEQAREEARDTAADMEEREAPTKAGPRAADDEPRVAFAETARVETPMAESVELRVLRAVQADPRFKRRTASGIADDAGLSRLDTERVLRELRAAGLVQDIASRDGRRTLWRVTDAGYAVLAKA